MTTSNVKAMILSKCAICGTKKSGFIKNQGGKNLLSNFGINTQLGKVLILAIFYFELHKK